jgi:hypothetical protein
LTNPVLSSLTASAACGWKCIISEDNWVRWQTTSSLCPLGPLDCELLVASLRKLLAPTVQHERIRLELRSRDDATAMDGC